MSMIQTNGYEKKKQTQTLAFILVASYWAINIRHLVGPQFCGLHGTWGENTKNHFKLGSSFCSSFDLGTHIIGPESIYGDLIALWLDESTTNLKMTKFTWPCHNTCQESMSLRLGLRFKHPYKESFVKTYTPYKLLQHIANVGATLGVQLGPSQPGRCGATP